MVSALIIGSAVGAIIGFIHAGYVYRQQINAFPERFAEHPFVVRARAIYFALWTITLWVLFGSYLFYLWLISVVIYATYHALKRSRLCCRSP